MLVKKINCGLINCHEVPYAFTEDLTVYGLLCSVVENQNEIIEQMNSDFQDTLNKYMDTYFNSIMINAIYDEPTETITLSKEMKIEGRYHSVENNNLVISG